MTPSGETTEPCLAAWLTQIWDEDEALAKAAKSQARGSLAADSGDWETFQNGGVQDVASRDTIVYDEGSPSPEQAEFIARNDPALALARIVAEREILATHYLEAGACAECGDPLEYTVAWPCPTLRLIATIYADRPGFLEEWRA